MRKYVDDQKTTKNNRRKNQREKKINAKKMLIWLKALGEWLNHLIVVQLNVCGKPKFDQSNMCKKNPWPLKKWKKAFRIFIGKSINLAIISCFIDEFGHHDMEHDLNMIGVSVCAHVCVWRRDTAYRTR